MNDVKGDFLLSIRAVAFFGIKGPFNQDAMSPCSGNRGHLSVPKDCGVEEYLFSL